MNLLIRAHRENGNVDKDGQHLPRVSEKMALKKNGLTDFFWAQILITFSKPTVNQSQH